MINNTSILVAKYYQHVAKVTLVTVVIWTVVVLANILQKDYPSEVEPSLLAPLTPSMDESVIDTLSRREQMEELLKTYIPPSPTPKPAGK